jgi:hypothetical protein
MDAEQQKRLDELKAKAEGPGLTSDEANELGKLYAVESGAEYANASTVGDSGLIQEDAENEMLRKEQAAQVAAKAHDEYRSQMLPGEGSTGV